MMYTALIIVMSLSIQTVLDEGNETGILYLSVSIIASILLSMLYAWLLIRFRRLEIATLKCVGYTNQNIRVVIMGEIIWVTCVAFFIVIEMLIHITAVQAYALFILGDLNALAPFLKIEYLAATVGIFLVAQLFGITLAYGKILKLRPIVALRVMK